MPMSLKGGSRPLHLGPMLLIAASLKLIAEIALMALLGQGFLALLAGDRRQDNFFYKLLQILTGPFTKLARVITPKVVIDRHIPFAAFALMVAVWVFATMTKVNQCVEIQLASTLCR
jgi:hypothetical protein